MGTANGDPLPIRNDQGTVIGYKKDANGEVVLSKLDEATLSKIASITGGAYFVSGENGFVADNLYKVISNMEKEALESKMFEQYQDRYQPILLVVLMLLLIEGFISERRRVSLAWKGRL